MSYYCVYLFSFLEKINHTKKKKSQTKKGCHITGSNNDSTEVCVRVEEYNENFSKCC